MAWKLLYVMLEIVVANRSLVLNILFLFNNFDDNLARKEELIMNIKIYFLCQFGFNRIEQFDFNA